MEYDEDTGTAWGSCSARSEPCHSRGTVEYSPRYAWADGPNGPTFALCADCVEAAQKAADHDVYLKEMAASRPWIWTVTS